jgi:hypothetical protein
MNNLEISFIILLIILIYFMSDISNYIKNSKYVYIELFQNSQSEEEQDNNIVDEENIDVYDDTPDEEIDDEEEITISTKNTETHTTKTAIETVPPEPSFTKSSNGFELLSKNFDGNINLYSPRVNKQL